MTLRRGGLLLPVLVLPLTVPVLIFGVAASNAAIVGPVPFGTPFTILCALTLSQPGHGRLRRRRRCGTVWNDDAHRSSVGTE